MFTQGKQDQGISGALAVLGSQGSNDELYLFPILQLSSSILAIQAPIAHPDVWPELTL